MAKTISVRETVDILEGLIVVRAVCALLLTLLPCPLSYRANYRELVVKNLAPRPQILVLQRQGRQPRLHSANLWLWVMLKSCWPDRKVAALIFQPRTLIGSIRRGCLDRVIVLNERQLRHILGGYLAYHHEVRSHRSLAHGSPVPRPVQSLERGKEIEMPLVGGLHHRYLRVAA